MACSKAGAEYDELEKICICPKGQIFDAIAEDGICLSPKITIQKNKIVFEFSQEVKKAYISYLDYSQNEEINSTVVDRLSEFIRRRSLPIFPGQISIVITKFVKEMGVIYDLIPLGRPSTELSKKDGNVAVKNKVQAQSLLPILLPSPLKFLVHDEVSNLILEAMEQLSVGLDKAQVVAFNEKGCAGICIEKSVIIENVRFIVERIRVFSGGNPMSDLIRVFNKAYLYYPSSVVLVNRQASYLLNTEENGRIFVVSPDGQFVGEKSPEIQKPEFGSPAGVPVVLFEGIYQDFINRAVLAGPHLNSSYFGWFSESDQKPFYYGRHTTLIGEEDEGDFTHGAIVSSLASSKFKKPIIPLSLNAALTDDFLKVWKKFNNKKMVASISFASTFSYRACENSPISKNIQTTQNSVLWFVAASNDGAHIDNSEDAYCPQGLKSNNLVLVASSDNGVSLTSSSNFGINYVDLLESGCMSDTDICPEQAGTSFAAPRLARKAADLFEKYPQISPDQMKNILMLTSKIPIPKVSDDNSDDALWVKNNLKWQPVRSGGFVDIEAAEAFIQEAIKTSYDLSQLNKGDQDELIELLIKAKKSQFNFIGNTQSNQVSLKKRIMKYQISRVFGMVKEVY